MFTLRKKQVIILDVCYTLQNCNFAGSISEKIQQITITFASFFVCLF